MQFNWYKKTLEKRLRDLKNLRKNACGQKLIIIVSTIEDIESIIRPGRIVDTSINFSLETDYLNMTSTSFLWPIIKEIAKQPELPILNSNLTNDVNLNDNEILECVHNFFNLNADEKTKEIFNKYWQSHITHTKFITKAPQDFYGDTFYLGYYKEAYIQLKRQFVFDDISTLIHEYGHVIQFDSNYITAINPNLYPFSEIVSTFFELIGAEYYAQDKLEIPGIISQYLVCEELLEWSKTLTEELAIMKKIAIKSYENKNDLRANINSYVKNENINVIDELLKEDPFTYYKYTIGFLVACNLFMIYLSDQEFAFHLLHELIKINITSPEDYFNEIDKLGLTSIDQVASYRNHIKRKLTRL